MSILLKILLRSGPCLDTVPALRLCLRALDVPVLRQLVIASRLKFTPDVLERVRASGLPPAEKARLFSSAMNLFRSGSTFKTTGAGRTPLTDREILAKAGPGDEILEVGVSDGISALGLLEARGGRGVTLSDRQDAFRCRDFGPLRVFYDREDGLLSVKFLFLYLCTWLAAGEPPPDARRVRLLNPEVLERFPAAELVRFDIFTDVLPRKAAFIKCANVLNKAYFGPADARRAVANLARSLEEGGWLFVSQANAAYADGEAWLALRLTGGRLRLAGEANSHELLADLKSAAFAGLVDA